MEKQEALAKMENAISILQDEYYKNNPRSKELPKHLWDLFSVKEYYIARKKK